MKAECIATAASVGHLLKTTSPSPFVWDLRWKPVCSSTELLLTKWLREKPYSVSSQFPRAVFASQQRFGKGQNDRGWTASPGGVWISAAFPWPSEQQSAGILGLAVALTLSERIERYGLPVKIKWPNDLVVGEKKLAGLLPGLIHRGGKVRFARLGLGLNVSNKVPLEGVAIRDLLSQGKSRLKPWTLEVLLALERAIVISNQTDWLCDQIEKRLWAKEVFDMSTGKKWFIKGVSSQGGLKVFDSSGESVLNRWN